MRLLACLLLAACGAPRPPADPYAYPRNECAGGAEVTYHTADGSWDLTARADCRRGW